MLKVGLVTARVPMTSLMRHQAWRTRSQIAPRT
jgi:hypothetical protein